MTTEERFARIEHVTAGLAEERRRDREEYRMLWRATQEQIHQLTLKIADTNDQVSKAYDVISKYVEESRAQNARLSARIEEMGQALDARIAALVSAIGQLVAKG